MTGRRILDTQAPSRRSSDMSRFRIQTHGRLQEWVAEEKGYFSEEGLDYEFVDNTLMNDRVAAASISEVDEYRSGAYETMEEGNACAVGSACHWAVNQAAASSHGMMWGEAYSVTPAGIYVAGGSAVSKPSDLAGVAVGVGYHSGSHFSALAAMQSILEPGEINLVYKGGPVDRLTRLLESSIPAANLFGNPMYVAEQLGFRKVVDTTFMIGFFIEGNAEKSDVERYFRALQRAQRDIDAEPERYKHYFLRELPTEFHDRVEVQGFGTGERIVFEPYTREVYESTRQWMQSNDLFDTTGNVERSYEEAVLVS
jgi:NitT/TauT family transport system substrate-binding protein